MRMNYFYALTILYDKFSYLYFWYLQLSEAFVPE